MCRIGGQNFYFFDFDMTDTILEILPEHITAIVVNPDIAQHQNGGQHQKVRAVRGFGAGLANGLLGEIT